MSFQTIEEYFLAHKNDQGTISPVTNGELVPSHKNPHLAECHGDLLPDLDQSVWDMLLITATQYPKRDAIVSLWQPATHLDNLVCRKNAKQTNPETEGKASTEEEFFRWTYEELISAVEHLAGYLQSKGCVEGENLVSKIQAESLQGNQTLMKFAGSIPLELSRMGPLLLGRSPLKNALHSPRPTQHVRNSR
jgi:hypothetical protein